MILSNITFAQGLIAVLFFTGFSLLAIYGYRSLRSLRRVLLMTLDEVQKVRKLELKAEQLCDNLFRQLENLDRLYRDLGFSKSLPATRGWPASPDFLVELSSHVAKSYPGVVVECGSGVSTLVVARSLQLNGFGHLYSLEHIAEYGEKTRRELELHGLADWATVIDAPLVPQHINGSTYVWYSTRGLTVNDIDMLIVDGPPEQPDKLVRYPAGPMLFGKLRPGGAVFLDDASRTTEQLTVEKWQQDYPDFRLERRDCEKGCAVLSNDGFSPAELQKQVSHSRTAR